MMQQLTNKSGPATLQLSKQAGVEQAGARNVLF
jgi:hypothetical protein